MTGISLVHGWRQVLMYLSARELTFLFQCFVWWSGGIYGVEIVSILFHVHLSKFLLQGFIASYTSSPMDFLFLLHDHPL
jgi:hypothetical protein